MVGIFHQYLITINKQDGGCNRVKPTLQLILMGSEYVWIDILDIFQEAYVMKVCRVHDYDRSIIQINVLPSNY